MNLIGEYGIENNLILIIELLKVCFKGHLSCDQETCSNRFGKCYMLHPSNALICLSAYKRYEKFCSKDQVNETHYLSLTHAFQLNHHVPWNVIPAYPEDKNATHSSRLSFKNI